MANATYRGGKFYISTTTVSADLTKTAYEALSWTEVGNVVTTAGMGVTDNIISQDLIDTDVSQKQKGFAQVNDGELVVAYDPDDAGQAALLAAASSRSGYAFKSELADAVTPVTGDGTTRYTWGYVGGGGDAGGGGEDFVNLTFSLALNQRPIWVDPT